MTSRPLAALAAALTLAACAGAPPADGTDGPFIEGTTATDVTQTTMPAPPERPRNVVLFIADGFGPASATLGSAAAEARGDTWALGDGLGGSVETSATDNRVTDSAASATAYSCGLKTYNGAIAMTADKEPCPTVLERAEARGMATGLVATSRITHATPASFAAHVEQRGQEAEIAAQLVGAGVDVMLGGGMRFFQGREDGRDLVAELRASGVTVATDRAGFDALRAAPAAAILAESHLDYEVDRDASQQPSLAEMTAKALDLLSAAAPVAGFFVMIEASRIDHAAHGNDPVGHLGDILAYNEAVRVAREWAARDGETLVVATADHETGGMTLGRGGAYFWDPAPLLRATSSIEALGPRLNRSMETDGDPVELIREAAGVAELEEGMDEAIRGMMASGDETALREMVVGLLSEPAGIGWTTSGHTAVDVGLYAWGPGAERFTGRMVNADVGRALFAALGLRR